MMPNGRWYSADYTDNAIAGSHAIDGKPAYNSAGIFARSERRLVQYHMTGPDGEWSSRVLSDGRGGAIGDNDPVTTADAVYVANVRDHLWQYWPGTGDNWPIRH